MEAYRRPRARRPFDRRSRASLIERAGFASLDPVLLVRRDRADRVQRSTRSASRPSDDVPGNPYYYVVRQSIYAVVGIALMFAVARIDYSRFRELRVGIYTAMIASILLVFVFAEATRGSHRWIELPFFTFQPSELGKVLLVVTLAAFAIDRSRRGDSEWRRTVRLLALGLFPAALVFLQPDLGTALVYGVITLAVLFIAGMPWTHFAALVGGAVALIAMVLVIAPAVGVPILADVPAGAPDRLPAPQRRPR